MDRLEKEAIITFLARKRKHKDSKLNAMYESACRDVERIICALSDKYPDCRIYQWGSLLDRRRFNEASDIDLAVEGVTSPKMFFDILGTAMELTDFSIDVVELEQLTPERKNRIIREGKLRYEPRDCNT